MIFQYRIQWAMAFTFCCLLLSMSLAFAQQDKVKNTPNLAFATPLNEADIIDADLDALSSHLDNLLQAPDLKLEDVLGDAELILSHAQTIQAPRLEMEAASIIILRIAGTEQEDRFQQLVDYYLLKAINQDANVALSRMYRALLRKANISGNHESSVSLKRQLIGLLDKDLPALEEGLALLSIGINDFYTERYYGALTFLERAMDTFQRNGFDAQIDRVLSMLALVNSRLGNDQRAIDIQKEIAKRLRLSYKNISWSILDYNIASAYYDLKEYSQAKEYALQSKEVALDFNDQDSVAFANLILSRIALATGNYSEAKYLSADAGSSFLSSNNATRHVQALFIQLKAELRLDDLASAEMNFDKLVKLQNLQSNSDSDVEMLEVTALVEEARGNIAEALDFQRRFHEASLNSQLNQQTRSIEQLLNELAVDVTESEAQYSLQKSKSAELENKLVTQNRMALVLGALVVILFLLVVALLVFFRMRAKRINETFIEVDGLTQGPNQSFCFKAAKLAFNQAAVGHHSTVIAVVDLDDFSQINMSYGHGIGDKILQRFVLSLRKILRQQDSFGRIGSDQWLLVCPRSSIEYVTKLFSELREFYRQSATDLVKPTDSLTFSIGAVTTLSGFANIEEMIVAAEKLAAQAKTNGKDRLEINSP